MNDTAIKDLKILVVEDEEFMLNMIVRLLKNFDIQTITTALNGQDALQEMEEAKEKSQLEFDLIFCDLEMPIMDGFQFLKNLRGSADTGNRNVPVIILTGHGDKEHFRGSAGVGVSWIPGQAGYSGIARENSPNLLE
ncbi:MAG: response regulator [Nitrospinota bacterium]